MSPLGLQEPGWGINPAHQYPQRVIRGILRCQVFHRHRHRRHNRRVVKKNSPPLKVHPSLPPAKRQCLLKVVVHPRDRMRGFQTMTIINTAGVGVRVPVVVVPVGVVARVAATLRKDHGNRNKAVDPPRIETASRRQITPTNCLLRRLLHRRRLKPEQSMGVETTTTTKRRQVGRRHDKSGIMMMKLQAMMMTVGPAAKVNLRKEVHLRVVVVLEAAEATEAHDAEERTAMVVGISKAGHNSEALVATVLKANRANTIR